ncbi:carbonic anhydrase-like [Amphiura filiformis]|uniref:carbonic anhydrase-like n=1 Tax=Amphiura filiformis TaxID=82378 RepID=UPI003B2131FD
MVNILLRHYLMFGLLFAASHAADWTHHGSHGASSWPDLFPEHCDGVKQSPINIIPKTAEYSTSGPIEFHGYRKQDIPNPSQMDFINNGHTVQVDITGDFYIRGGPLEATYQAAQFHFHWGSIDSQGSEHTLNGKPYPAEMHIVHWDRDNYQSIGEAVGNKNGLAVLGVFLKVGQPNHAFDELVKVMDKVKFKDDKYTFPTVFPIAGLMPHKEDLKNYFYYEGSLTTPKCNEVVQWIVYETPIEVSVEQLQALRSVYENKNQGGSTNTHLSDNFRPTQPLNQRKVYVAGAIHWPEMFPDSCAGSKQSPINIIPTTAEYSTYGPIEFHGYRKEDMPNPSQMVFVNNGYTVQVNIAGDVYIRGGPLNATYKAAQFNFHWGSIDSQGSEHTLNGKPYPAEVCICLVFILVGSAEGGESMECMWNRGEFLYVQAGRSYREVWDETPTYLDLSGKRVCMWIGVTSRNYEIFINGHTSVVVGQDVDSAIN